VQYYYRVRPTDGTESGEWSNIDGAVAFSGASVPSGIAYNRPDPTGQSTSYVTGDDPYVADNRDYPDPPVYPEIIQRMDHSHATPFLFLKYNNAFGNKNRRMMALVAN
jgi:hypothetical protein